MTLSHLICMSSMLEMFTPSVALSARLQCSVFQNYTKKEQKLFKY